MRPQPRRCSKSRAARATCRFRASCHRRPRLGVPAPHHPLALRVLAITGPLAVTSANRSGEATPRECDGLARAFGARVAVYLCQDEPLEGTASTVVDVTDGDLRVLRTGSLAETDLLEALET